MKITTRTTNFFKPFSKVNYTKSGKFELENKRASLLIKDKKSGVYIIKKNSKVVYIGHSKTDVKKTLYRHFQVWNDRRHPDNKKVSIHERVTYFGQDYDNFLIKVFFTNTARQAEELEKNLIIRLKPKDNEIKYLNYQYSADFEIIENKINYKDEVPF